jgi:hypothetical protein
MDVGNDIYYDILLLIPNPINSCANGSGIPNLRQMPWSRMHKDSWELVLGISRPLEYGIVG